MPFEEEEVPLVPEVMGSEGRGISKSLLLAVAVAVLVVAIAPAPQQPAARVEVGVHNEAAGTLGEALVGDPHHHHVVDFVVGAYADRGHEILLHDTPNVLGEIGPAEDGTEDDDDDGYVEVEIDAEVGLDGAREDGEARDEVVEQGELGSVHGRGQRLTRAVVAAHGGGLRVVYLYIYETSVKVGRGKEGKGQMMQVAETQ